MKIWIKISSENKQMGAWFFDLTLAREMANPHEMLVPVEFPEWPNVKDDATHRLPDLDTGRFIHKMIDDAVDRAVRDLRLKGVL